MDIYWQDIIKNFNLEHQIKLTHLTSKSYLAASECLEYSKCRDIIASSRDLITLIVATQNKMPLFVMKYLYTTINHNKFCCYEEKLIILELLLRNSNTAQLDAYYEFISPGIFEFYISENCLVRLALKKQGNSILWLLRHGLIKPCVSFTIDHRVFRYNIKHAKIWASYGISFLENIYAVYRRELLLEVKKWYEIHSPFNGVHQAKTKKAYVEYSNGRIEIENINDDDEVRERLQSPARTWHDDYYSDLDWFITLCLNGNIGLFSLVWDIFVSSKGGIDDINDKFTMFKTDYNEFLITCSPLMQRKIKNIKYQIDIVLWGDLID